MGARDNSTVAVSGARLKREDCGRTKHDSAFSDWQVLVGSSDWEDYAQGKEGAARYRVHNLPPSSSPGLYELGAVSSRAKSGRDIRKLDSSYVIVVYVGQADCVRTRLQQYGRSGAHLGNSSLIAPCESDDPEKKSAGSDKQLGLFCDVLSRGYSIVFRWAPMNNKGDALRMEAMLLNTFDYAWNKGSNGARRPCDIVRKLKEASSTGYRVSSITKKLLPFLEKKVGVRIEGRLPSPGTRDSTRAEEVENFLYGIFKFSRSNPRLVDDRSRYNEDEAGFCGIPVGDGDICRKPPVKGRKRCPEHKGMRINAAHSQLLVPDQRGVTTDQGIEDLAFFDGKLKLDAPNLPATQSFNSVLCGFILGDGSSCGKPPVAGRQRCSEHKGRKIVTLSSLSSSSVTNYPLQNDDNITEISRGGESEARFQSEKCDARSKTAAVCRIDYGDGTFCSRQPARGRVRCEEHKGMRATRAKRYVT